MQRERNEKAGTPGGDAVTGEEQEQPSLKRAIGPGLLLLFIVGDILGAGIYALAGKVASEIGGIAWLPFVVAFGIAVLTACSYLELVTKYPRAGGSAVYAQRAFGIKFLTFLVGLMVMFSGLTSAAAGARAFAANLEGVLGVNPITIGLGIPLVALAFMVLLALINLRGVSESVRLNVVLTLIELSGLLIIISIGVWALLHGTGNLSRLTQVRVDEGETVLSALAAATALTFYTILGFEDAVNMVEETKNPLRTFPRIMLLGISITVTIYILVVITAVTLVDPLNLGKGDAPLLDVVKAGAPHFPIGIFGVISMFAVANTALINMLMGSRLLYGMAEEGVLPAIFGRVGHRRQTPWVAIILTTVLAFFLIAFADLRALAGTTSLLLLIVFMVTNISVLALRRRPAPHPHFRTPLVFPILGALACGYLASPFSGRPLQEYVIAGYLLAGGIALWILERMLARVLRKAGHETMAEKDPTA